MQPRVQSCLPMGIKAKADKAVGLSSIDELAPSLEPGLRMSCHNILGGMVQTRVCQPKVHFSACGG